MTVDISIEIDHVDKVWFDASCGKLFVQAGDFVNAIDLRKMDDADFESISAIESFGLGQSGSVVVCRHKDGKETWLSVDLWEPSGFTPTAKKRTDS
jgi:hypothetical protein